MLSVTKSRRPRRARACPSSAPGHPLADVFLLKYAPRAAELQEGVAFYGRAGNALLKSLQRLRVDPMAIYGTNCLKFADGDEDESRPFLLRELHIVQPKLVVVMGEQALAFLNSVAVPARARARARPRASCRSSRRRSTRSSRRTSTTRSTSSPRRRASGTRSSCSASGGHRFLRTKRGRASRRSSPSPRSSCAWFIVAPHLAPARPLAGDRARLGRRSCRRRCCSS